MTKTYPQEFDMIVQSLSTVALINSMGPTCVGDDSDALRRSEFYKMLALDPLVKWAIDQTGVGNRGFALMSLYALLLLPKELISDCYADEYAAIEDEMPQWTQNTRNIGYKKLQYIRHIRNAVAHGNIEFDTEDVIRFRDSGKEYGNLRSQCQNCNDKEYEVIPCEFSTEIKLSNLGCFLNRLQSVHMRYIQDNA
jgi:hypothetical protein